MPVRTASKRNIFWALLLSLLATAPLAAAPTLVITEIHYHPPEGDGAQFVEILSREPPRVDLGGFSIEGEAHFRFPEGTVLAAGEFLVVAADPVAFRKAHPEVARVAGPWGGRLDRAGGKIVLRNAAGGVACALRYGSRNPWPAIPDGTGHTLSLVDPRLDPADPRNWAPSLRIGGTPGRGHHDASGRADEGKGATLVRKGERWNFWRGKRAPDARWRALDFDDRSWEAGSSSFGYGDGDDATVLDDMRGHYLAVYTRKAFEAADPALLGDLVLRVDYDDGFVASLNGREIARANLGLPGSPVTFQDRAKGTHEAGVPVEFELGAAAGLLRVGKNVLTAEGHNESLQSSDLSLAVELLVRARSARLGNSARPVINEVVLADDPRRASIELYNAGAGEIDLSGYFLSDDRRRLQKYPLPAGSVLRPRAFLSLGGEGLGEVVSLRRSPGGKGKGGLFFTLTDPNGERVLDAVPLPREETPLAESGAALERILGRFPDGAGELLHLLSPTPGGPNRRRPLPAVTVSEIHYHPVSGNEGEEFIELENSSGEPISLAGFRLAGAVRFTFPEGARLERGGLLVVAGDPSVLEKRYGLPAGAPLGPWRGKLPGEGGRIELLDPLGDLVRRVDYGDRDPWPRWADGYGSTLELRHPALDPALPASWAASEEGSRAGWESLQYRGSVHSFQGIGADEFQFILLGEGECLIDDVRIALVDGDEVFAEDFEGGAASWQALGNHERSGHAPAPPAAAATKASGDSAAYRIISDGRGNPRHNGVAATLGSSLERGKSFEVSFRARWVRGCPLLLSRTPGLGLEKLHRLAIPAAPGSPGRASRVRAADPPPVVGLPAQSPIAPRPGEPVTVRARVSSVSPLREVAVRFSLEGQGEKRVPLRDDGAGSDSAAGDGEWSGEIPGLAAGTVRFWIEAVDDRGKIGTYPADAPARACLYAVGMPPAGRLPVYTVLLSSEERQELASRPRMANRLSDASLVYRPAAGSGSPIGAGRIFYNVGFRHRGSPFTRSSHNWRIAFGAETLDGRRTLTLDGQGGDGRRPNERLTYWLADMLRVPTPRESYVQLRIPGVEEGIVEDVEKIDRLFLARWFPESRRKGPSGEGAPVRETDRPLHKIDDHWEIPSSGGQSYREADFTARRRESEEQRWNFPPRVNRTEEGWTPLLDLIELLDPRRTPDGPFRERVETAVDVDGWTRILAVRALVDDWDTMGRTRGKNAYLFRPAGDRRWRLLPWDCDLAWRDPYASLFTGRFSGIDRFLGASGIRRRYLGYLDYLAERLLEPARFSAILADLRRVSGASESLTEGFLRFAGARREVIRGQIPRGPFAVRSARRESRAGEADRAILEGVAPPMVMRFRLAGREGTVRLVGEDRWEAEIPLGPEGGALPLEGLDPGGTPVASEKVKIEARPGAKPLSAAAETGRIDRGPAEAAENAGVAEAPAGDERALEGTESAVETAVEAAATEGAADPRPDPRPALFRSRNLDLEAHRNENRPPPRPPVPPRQPISIPGGPAILTAILIVSGVILLRRRRR